VQFEDTQSGTSPIAVTLYTTVTPPSVTANNWTKTYTISGGGKIAGTSTPLTKQGTDTLTLNGSAVNTFAGGLNANGGR